MNKRILIIESDKSILEVLELTLAHEGYQTIGSQHFYALNAIDWARIKLILIDHSIDAYSGHLLCTQLKKMETSKDIPIILLSTHPQLDKISHDSGADGYLEKPFDISYLLGMVSNYCSKEI